MACSHPLPLSVSTDADAEEVTRVETEPLRGPAPRTLPHLRAASRREPFANAAAVRVGRFSLLSRLGQGGMAVVYSAYDDELDRRVAIKVLCTPEGSEASGDGTGSDLLDRSTIRPNRLHRDDLLDLPITCTGVVMGTPAYMPPEQFQGRRTCPKTDQFSFCVSLYEALYGERPFAGDSRDALAENATGGHLRPIPPGRDVPGWLRDAVLRGLSPDPADRWPSMNELLAALRRRSARRRIAWLAAALGGLATFVGMAPTVEAAPEAATAGEHPPGWMDWA